MSLHVPKMMTTLGPGIITLVIVQSIPREVEFSLFVKDDLHHVEAYRSKKKLPIRDRYVDCLALPYGLLIYMDSEQKFFIRESVPK